MSTSKFKIGDHVKVIKGSYKGKTGKIKTIFPGGEDNGRRTYRISSIDFEFFSYELKKIDNCQKKVTNVDKYDTKELICAINKAI